MRAQFAGTVQAPAQARTFVLGQLRLLLGKRTGLSGDDIVLAVSELVTNSVRAGAGTIDVSLHADEGRIEIEVTDDAAGWPTPRKAAAGDVNGRGLAIVEQLADSWSTRARRPGKTVTATWFR